MVNPFVPDTPEVCRTALWAIEQTFCVYVAVVKSARLFVEVPWQRHKYDARFTCVRAQTWNRGPWRTTWEPGFRHGDKKADFDWKPLLDTVERYHYHRDVIELASDPGFGMLGLFAETDRVRYEHAMAEHDCMLRFAATLDDPRDRADAAPPPTPDPFGPHWAAFTLSPTAHRDRYGVPLRLREARDRLNTLR